MMQIVEFQLEDGTSIQVEVNESSNKDTIRAGRSIIPEKAKQTFEEAISKVVPVTKGVIEQLKVLHDSLDEIEISFGFTLSAEAGIILTSLSQSANFNLVLRWSKAKPGTPS